MSTIVKTRIVSIGNSQGIRLPKLLLEQIGLSGPVEIEAQGDQLIVRPDRTQHTKARSGWAEAFAEMAERGDDELLDSPTPISQWDDEEWQW